MKIYDCISFLNEFDVLDIRLNELSPVVDKFVIVEAGMTHSGLKKEFNFEKQWPRFEKFKDQIIYVKLKELYGDICWARDAYQQNAIWTMPELQKLNIGSNVIIDGDIDEIPKLEVLKSAIINLFKTNAPQMIYIDLFFYYLNTICTNNTRWPGPELSFRYHFNNNVRDLRGNREKFNSFTGGWHYSFCGNSDIISNKLRSYCHSFEFDTPEINNKERIEKLIKENKSILNDGRVFNKIESKKENFPEYVWQNYDKFEHLFLH